MFEPMRKEHVVVGEIYRALNVDYNKRLPKQDGVG